MHVRHRGWVMCTNLKDLLGATIYGTIRTMDKMKTCMQRENHWFSFINSNPCSNFTHRFHNKLLRNWSLKFPVHCWEKLYHKKDCVVLLQKGKYVFCTRNGQMAIKGSKSTREKRWSLICTCAGGCVRACSPALCKWLQEVESQPAVSLDQ